MALQIDDSMHMDYHAWESDRDPSNPSPATSTSSKPSSASAGTAPLSPPRVTNRLHPESFYRDEVPIPAPPKAKMVAESSAQPAKPPLHTPLNPRGWTFLVKRLDILSFLSAFEHLRAKKDEQRAHSIIFKTVNYYQNVKQTVEFKYTPEETIERAEAFARGLTMEIPRGRKWYLLQAISAYFRGLVAKCDEELAKATDEEIEEDLAYGNLSWLLLQKEDQLYFSTILEKLDECAEIAIKYVEMGGNLYE